MRPGQGKNGKASGAGPRQVGSSADRLLCPAVNPT